MRLNSASVAVFALLVASIAVPRILAAPHYEPWSTPVNLGAPVNSPFSETKATLSKDGSSLYFASNRPCAAGDAVLDANMWVAHRSLLDGPWETAECLSINTDTTISGLPVSEDSAPTLSRDEHWLYFVSDRPGSFGSPGFFGRDIWVSWRSDVHDDQGWGEPFNMGAPVNTTAAETGPAY